MAEYSYVNAFKHGDNVHVWERTDRGRRLVSYEAPYFFFVEDEKGEYKSLFGKNLRKVSFKSGVTFYEEKARLKREGVQLYESDITPIQKILTEHYYQLPAPNLYCTYLDIEVDYDKNIGFSTVENSYAPINSVALYHDWLDKTVLLTVPPKDWDGKLDNDIYQLAEVVICQNEKELLLRLIMEIQPADGIVGWNSQLFDIPYICKRIVKVLGENHLKKMSFEHGRAPIFEEVTIFNKKQTKVTLDGRLSIDYLELFKKFEMESRPSYKLESISNELLPDMAKLEYEGTLYDLYRKDYNYFLRYNIRDVECLHGFEQKLGYIALANELYHESTGQFANILGTIKLADLSIANYCHYELDVKVPDSKEVSENTFQNDSAKGAYVLKPKQSLQKWIGSVDIASLYPSAIRSINISPETLIGQFESNVDAFERLQQDTNDELSALIELDDGTTESITHPVSEWKKIFKINKWAVSGYGTIFSQESNGVIPAVLSLWYRKRKEFKKLMFKSKSNNDKEKTAYYDRLQYCYKIKLNSLYGALLNEHFRFYDKRLGESTTGTGRAILRHMCAKTNKILMDEYDPNGEAVVYGDTDSCYFKTLADNVNDAVEIANAVEQLINQSFPAFMRQAFFCTSEYDNYISAEREIVASAGIFVTPKRYILHLVDKEGTLCDDLKIMGLDTKKTILPVSVRNKLNGFLGRYLRGENWDVISRDIVEYKKSLRTDPDVTILGLPKGINKLEYYTDIFQTDEDATIPGHVRASILYNQKLAEFNDTESMPITSSMKIKVFYLKNPIKKFKSIALPVDAETVPKWFTETINVDKEKQIERLVDNPLKNVLKAINKEPPTEQTLFLEDELEF